MAGKQRLPITRRIVRILASDQRTLIPGPYPATDDELRDTFATLLRMEVAAHLLNHAGQLPDGWQLVHELRAEGLTRARDLVDWPEIIAAMQWRGLSVVERGYHVDEWRLITRGPDKGKVCLVDVAHRTGDLVEVPPISVTAVMRLPDASPYPSNT